MLNEIRRTFREMDKSLLFAIVAASIFGIVVIISASKSIGLRYPIVQSATFFVGFIAMIIVASIDYDFFTHNAKYIYGICIALLIFVLISGVGAEVGGLSWLRFGDYLGIQPSELVKVGFAITLAKHLDFVKEKLERPMTVLGVFLHFFILLILVLMQPDYGTAMVYIFMFICMVFTAGIQLRYFGIAIGAFALFAPIAWKFILKPYQIQRFMVFFNPNLDTSASGYQVLQSKIAIGSGQFFGQGLFKGTQTQMSLIPAKHTDFIFAVIGEEAGFIGCAIAILLLTFIIFRIISIARMAKNGTGTYMCVGIAAMIIFQTFENIGMCMGVMPVTGIPLPFFSYGGSSMLTNMLAMGFVFNVWIRRKTINF